MDDLQSHVSCGVLQPVFLPLDWDFPVSNELVAVLLYTCYFLVYLFLSKKSCLSICYDTGKANPTTKSEPYNSGFSLSQFFIPVYCLGLEIIYMYICLHIAALNVVLKLCWITVLSNVFFSFLRKKNKLYLWLGRKKFLCGFVSSGCADWLNCAS